MANQDVLVGLSDPIEALRAELIESIARGSNQEIQFGLDPIELTVEAAVTRGAEGGLSWHILRAGAKYENANTQTLKLRLTPMRTLAGGARTTDFAIADVQEPGTPAQKFGGGPD